MLKIFFIMISFLIVNAAQAAPKKSEKCVACVTQSQRNQVQKKLDDLRAKVRQLEAENESLRNRPAPAAQMIETPVYREQVVTEETRVKKNLISFVGGMGPDSLYNRRKEARDGTELGLSYGPIVGAQYQRFIGETFAAGLQVTIPTYPDTKQPTVLVPLGFAF